MSLGAPRSEESVKASRTGMPPRWFLERSVQRRSAWDVIVLETCPECHRVPSPDWFGSPQWSRLNVWIKVFLPASDREAKSKGCFMSSVRTVCGDTFKPISTQHCFLSHRACLTPFYQFKVRANRAKRATLPINVPQVCFFCFFLVQTWIIPAVVSELKNKPTEVFSLHTGVHFGTKMTLRFGLCLFTTEFTSCFCTTSLPVR